jgi:ATP-dependent Clp protease ATP-binding subunit ClpC
MEAKFSPRVKDVIAFSKEEAMRLNNDFIGVEHLLLGMIREGGGKGIKILHDFNLDLTSIKLEIENTLNKTTPVTSNLGYNIPLVKQAEKY